MAAAVRPLDAASTVDFGGDPVCTRLAVEAERLSYGHQVNDVFATETSLIEPLPHQHIAVYERMLTQTRLRFLLADDAGAGKTIMSGLYIREMLARRRIRRILVVPPAGLIGNWRRELRTLFGLDFAIVVGTSAKNTNPFAGRDSDQLIVSVDTLAGPLMFGRLQEPAVDPYDLVIFDEAHKLSANQNPDFTVTKTERYRLAEAIAGADIDDARWKLGWSAQHLLLLTATPHMGKDAPYYFLWRLLEPQVLAAQEAFKQYPQEARRRHFLRRAKEEMLTYAGTPIYPQRLSNTLGFRLSQAEQRLYDETTWYIEQSYNRAAQINRSAARLAMSVFQRRLASSTYALLRSFERRLVKVEQAIAAIEDGRTSADELARRARTAAPTLAGLEERTADEEEAREGREEREIEDDEAVSTIFSSQVGDLRVEREQLARLVTLAAEVRASGSGSKFARLAEFLSDTRSTDDKLLVFTEHRDTLSFLIEELEKVGYAGKIATIHGGMAFDERDAQVEYFRRSGTEGGASLMLATDAAGEGLNMQFCWRMVNYDIPWNPARLEQRMGRVHRYGQSHDPVVIVNMVATTTREGRVMETLLAKLDLIRGEMGSGKVFDVVGRLFSSTRLTDLFENAYNQTGAAEAEAAIDTVLTRERVEDLVQADRARYGEGDIGPELPRLRAEREREELRRMIPGSVDALVRQGLPLFDLDVEGDLQDGFRFVERAPFALERLRAGLDAHEGTATTFSIRRPPSDTDIVFLRPGEVVFDLLRALVLERSEPDALRGSVFVDPLASAPYLLHVARVAVGRGRETVANELVAFKQAAQGAFEECAPGYLAMLLPARGTYEERGGLDGLPGALASYLSAAERYLTETVAAGRREVIVADLRRQLPQRESELRGGFAYEEAELARARTLWRDRAKSGSVEAKERMSAIRRRQTELEARRDAAIARLRVEPEEIVSRECSFVAHAYVLPTTDPAVRERFDADVEARAMAFVRGYEEAVGARVHDVSKPEGARRAGLADHPGFDLLALHASGERRCIEVKGRAGRGAVELTANEYEKLITLGQEGWLYAVYDCAATHPSLHRVRDPMKALSGRLKGSVIVEAEAIRAAATA